jgi:hypothetical protein
MGWRDGCAPRPPVHGHVDPVTFDFTAADALGQRLDGLRVAITANLDARATAQARLTDWAGGHRRAYDEHRATQETVLTGADLTAQIAHLRTAWDEAAAAQLAANRRAADVLADGGQVPR